MTNLHLWHSDKNFTELAETPYPESSGVIYNLYEDCIVQREEIERLNARIKELEVLSQGLNTRKVFVCIHCEGLYSDEPVSECDCMSGANTFIEGIAYIPEIKDLK